MSGRETQTAQTNGEMSPITPCLEYDSDNEIINVAWTHEPWIAVACQRKLQMLKFADK